MASVRSRQSDTVDLIADRHYGDTSMTVAILEANPGLAALGVVLPSGTLIVLPAQETPVQQGVNLWD